MTRILLIAFLASATAYPDRLQPAVCITGLIGSSSPVSVRQEKYLLEGYSYSLDGNVIPSLTAVHDGKLTLLHRPNSVIPNHYYQTKVTLPVPDSTKDTDNSRWAIQTVRWLPQGSIEFAALQGNRSFVVRLKNTEGLLPYQIVPLGNGRFLAAMLNPFHLDKLRIGIFEAKAGTVLMERETTLTVPGLFQKMVLSPDRQSFVLLLRNSPPWKLSARTLKIGAQATEAISEDGGVMHFSSRIRPGSQHVNYRDGYFSADGKHFVVAASGSSLGIYDHSLSDLEVLKGVLKTDGAQDFALQQIPRSSDFVVTDGQHSKVQILQLDAGANLLSLAALREGGKFGTVLSTSVNPINGQIAALYEFTNQQWNERRRFAVGIWQPSSVDGISTTYDHKLKFSVVEFSSEPGTKSQDPEVISFSSQGNYLVVTCVDGKQIVFDPNGKLAGTFVSTAEMNPGDFQPIGGGKTIFNEKTGQIIELQRHAAVLSNWTMKRR